MEKISNWIAQLFEGIKRRTSVPERAPFVPFRVLAFETWKVPEKFAPSTRVRPASASFSTSATRSASGGPSSRC